MLLFVLLALLSFDVKLSVKSEKIICNGTIFNDVYYDREVLIENLGRPYNLFMHIFSGTLFFSHTISNGTEVDFEIMSCQVAKRKCSTVQGIPGGYAIAYDSGNDDVYFGGHDGIYKYNFLTATADFFAEDGKSIWGLFVRKNFYYIEYPSQKLYVYQNEKYVLVAEAINIEIDNFFASKRGNVYFSNKTALYKVDRFSRSTIVLNDEIAFRQIVDDSYGDVYFCGHDGIYVEDIPYHRIKRLAKIDRSFGLTFDDKDAVVYSDKSAIYRLNPSIYNFECYEAIKNMNKKQNARSRYNQ